MHDASASAATLCVHSVVVREGFRRRGLAARMLGWYVRHVPCQPEFSHLRHVRLITKAHLIRFYGGKVGFDFVGLWPHTHGRDRWFEMELPLRRVRQCQADAFTVPGSAFSGNPAAGKSMSRRLFCFSFRVVFCLSCFFSGPVHGRPKLTSPSTNVLKWPSCRTTYRPSPTAGTAASPPAMRCRRRRL